ncbi:MAG TPA: hypothetical protein DDZ88_01370 [Verrucomicrobiales bacterium]|nr:hypothetical protein [Verrucomicrobiales bacterium]
MSLPTARPTPPSPCAITICSAARGIRIASAAPEGHAIIGNVVFAGEPLSLHNTITNVRDNIIAPVADTVLHLVNPQMTLGTLALHPKPGSCEGTPLDLSPFATETAFDLDFSGTSKGDRRIRGAYSAKAGWMLQSGIKPPSATQPKF